MTLAALSASAIPFAGMPAEVGPPSAFLHARRYVVASDSRAASEAGAELLGSGGNAVDAACATALALGVVDPFASGLGGGGFALVYLAKPAKAAALDFREVAPAGLRLADGDIRPQSGRSVGVPGEARGLAELVHRFGRLPFSRCVEPALRLARGFRATPRLAKQVADELERQPKSGPELVGKLFTINGRPATRVGADDLITRPNLARTLLRLRQSGADVLYRGSIARAIVRAVQDEGGALAAQDLVRYAPIEREPLASNAFGKRIVLMPPPSGGGIIIAIGLDIVAEHMADLRELGPRSPEYLHLLAEALKHGFADRARFIGDPDSAEIPVHRLLDPAYHHQLSLRTRADHVLEHLDYGMTYRLASGQQDGGTANVSVIDKDKNAVALTTTINLEFGARIVAGDTGILLNDEMDDFTAQGNGSDVFHLSGGQANLPGPGKRPASSMSPTLVLGDHGVELVAGAAGGPRIASTVLQILLDVMAFGMNVTDAVAAPRIHDQWEPDLLYYEDGFPAETIAGLEQRGHKTKLRRDIGKANAIVRTAAGLDAAADPRSGGQPAGR